MRMWPRGHLAQALGYRVMWSWFTNRLVSARSKIATPPSEEAYAVRIHNNDVTPMGFVTQALEASLQLKNDEAVRVMLRAHMHGSAEVGPMPLARAQGALAAILELAQRHGQPLKCEVVQFRPQAPPSASVA
jgi:ATP-dependent Clp protease adapter protein ClpS